MAPSSSASLRLGASALVLLLLTGCGGSAVSSDTTSSNAASTETSAAPELRGDRAVVERVIDGDTVDVQRDGEVVRVRLLNIDTPETKDPNEIVECLGPEATALLEELLPPGTVVGLEYDQERTDRYDRTLAGVFLEDGTLVNAEIARQGLGTPLYIAPNGRFLPPVEEAFAEAEQQQAGLLDPAQGCTIPAQLQQATSALADAAPADLADAAGEVAAAVAFLAALDAVDGDAHPHVRHLVGLPSLTSGISGVRQDVAALQERAAEQRRAAEAKVAERRAAEDQRRQAETDAARQAESAQQAELDRQAEAARQAATDAARRAVVPAPAPAPNPAPAPAPAPAPRPAPAPAPAPKPAPNPGANIVNQAPPGYYADIPGYTGPRCYAPGGKFFKPC
ncbi:thermonuclease family protein [Kocuria rosea]|uniref:thermonuclease family protein n=1 Tax=Kocuria rosea TaxID=1275 RepID=UPI000DFDE437|nr:thermonuclease family protein [Kocuria rosea]STX07458.1 Thermonuclease precursor [Kocuria rosea]